MEKLRDRIHNGQNPYAGLDPILPYDLQGWGSNDPSFADIISKIRPNLIVEVGTWKGASAVNMAKVALSFNIPSWDIEIVCVDTWLGSVEHYEFGSLNANIRKNGRPNFYEQFLSNVIHEKMTDIITPFPMDSINANQCMQAWDVHPDMIYIDAAHDYQSVKLDIYLWSIVLRSGGYMLFDDWHHEPIRRAAYEVFGADKIFEVGGKAAWIK